GGGGASTFLDLTDTPSSYSGYAKYSPMVKDDETGLAWQSFADMELESRTIYVDADNGSDTTGDGSESNPFQTYEKALSTVRNAIADGVTITIFLKAATNPYTWVDTSRLCAGSGLLKIQGEMNVLVSGTVDSATNTTLTDTGAFGTNDYSGKLIHITGGTGAGQWRVIDSNTADQVTVCGVWETTPDSTSTYEIVDWGTEFSGTVQPGNGRIEFELVKMPKCGPTAVRLDITCDRCSLEQYAPVDGSEYIRGIFDTCSFYTSAQQGCFRTDGKGVGTYVFRRCRLKMSGINYVVVYAKGAGHYFLIERGTVIDGGGAASYGIKVALAHARLFCQQTNGVWDKNTIRNNSVGLRVEAGGKATFTGTTYNTYSGNSTDREADTGTYSWYAN
ncbi:MAG: hypothetical protein DRJ03_05165, partial [Chloroflexi bacterium]